MVVSLSKFSKCFSQKYFGLFEFVLSYAFSAFFSKKKETKIKLSGEKIKQAGKCNRKRFNGATAKTSTI